MKLSKLLLTILLSLFISFPSLQAQTNFRVMWYNVENLFDTEDDPKTDDNEFLPSGERHWTGKRYRHKLQQLSKVITAAGEWQTPALVGLCEVENNTVLTHLLTRTPLREQHYRYCLTDGSDTRGIQVALLYQRDKFAYISHASCPIRSAVRRERPTRDILHVCGKLISGDTLDVFLCHFPSRSGGEQETKGYRADAARTLRTLCDSIHNERQTPLLLLMGDFNDTPADKNMRDVLGAQPFHKGIQPADGKASGLSLYNLFADASLFPYPGSHKYQGEWHQLDQIIVSGSLLGTPHRPVRLLPESIRLFAPPFLFAKDKTQRGLRPKRTFYGFRYERGFSDHLPLLIDLECTAILPPPIGQPLCLAAIPRWQGQNRKQAPVPVR
ncbi:Endonuclease/Exonuclease/phosphatase family protein [Bacteroidales bacterium Barb6]|nr:Endonuclease/Exonuclease/phosphatase family protein [Bacteroidales bacterium Barb6]